MRTLLIDTFGDALALAMRAQEIGHDVVHFIGKTNPRFQFIGAGLTKVVRDFSPWLTWADLVILCDNVVHLKQIDAFRRENPKVAVYGPTWEVAQWEVDRLTGQKVLLEHDIPIPACTEFGSFEPAIAHVKKTDGRYVCKPCGDADKALSYAAKTPEDMVFVLEKWAREGKIKGRFILQEYMEGDEFGVGAWVGKNGFLEAWEENWEHKKLMVGEIGPATGELGTVLRYTKKSRLADLMLKPLEKTLVELGYTGCIDINCIVDSEGNAWPLEFCCRKGYPALQIQMPLLPHDPVTWMHDHALGRGEPIIAPDIISTGVAMVMHPFPYPSYPLEQVLGFPVFGMTKNNRMHIAPYQMQKGTQTEWMTAGDYCLVCTGQGHTVRESTKQAYRTLGQIHIPGHMMYRVDIGWRLEKALPRLQKNGYASGMTF